MNIKVAFDTQKPVGKPGYQPAVAGPDLLSLCRQHVAKQGYSRPLLLISEDLLRENVSRFKAAMPRVQPHFAVKSNPDPRVLGILKDAGCRFEIASRRELEQLLAIGVSASEIIYSHPVKPPAYIRFALVNGVRWFAVDSVDEVRKLHGIDPGVALYVRCHTSNEGSCWPLTGKFGAQDEEISEIIAEAARLDMDLGGITFHVGSQCLNVENWLQGIKLAVRWFELLKSAGFKPRLLNLGGGYPVQISGEEPSIEEIGTAITPELARFDDSVQVVAEPGRNFVASAGCLVTQVVGTATRSGQRWIYLDTGVYGGLMEFTDNFRFRVHTDRHDPAVSWTLAGPTCDSIDVCVRDQQLPADMAAGDYLYLMDFGAYSACCATEFNGFPTPEVVMV